MQLSGRFSLFHSSRSEPRHIQERKRRASNCDIDPRPGRSGSRRLQRISHGHLQAQEETGRGFIPRHYNQGNLTLNRFIDYFDEVSSIKFDSFALHKRAKGDQIRFRSLFTALARQIGLFSFPQLGKVFNKDHSTIVHYEKKHQELWDEDDAYALIYMDLEQNIKKLIEEKHNED
jgi:hypothetical protein